jgi:Holliday junction resolvasome RuvABC DNA-binding subunit
MINRHGAIMKELPDRDGLARKIVEVSRDHADGYKRAITSFSTEAEKDIAEKCACAASNTGWWLLTALGYSNEEIRRAVDVVRRS